jgi:hypothetical protein
MKGLLQVKFAVYGALQNGNPNAPHTMDVCKQLQMQLDASNGIVAINNATMGGDPLVGTLKHFGAIVTLNGRDYAFACQEGQSIDFYQAAGLNPGQLVRDAMGVVRQ